MTDQFSDPDSTQTDPSTTDQDDLSTNTGPVPDTPIGDDSDTPSDTAEPTTGDGSGDTLTGDGSGDTSTGDGSGDTSTDEGGKDTINTFQYDVPALIQPSDMTCWATVATMMISWQDTTCYEIPMVMDRAGTTYRSKFDANQGLRGSEKQPFLDALNLRSEPPQDYVVVGMQQLIENCGPLWITTDESADEHFAIHARIVMGMTGDGSVDGTMLTIIDPADGQVHSETYNNFMQKFDRVAFDDMSMGSDFRVQVVHF